MNITRLRPPLSNLTSHWLIVGFTLITAPLYAQTFAGRAFLTESPVSIRAIITPDVRQEAVIIRFESLSSKNVRVRIIDKGQRTYYDEYVAKPRFYGRFDVSALPYGTYTVELSSSTARYTQQFRIQPQTRAWVVMVTDPPKRDSLLASY